MDDGVLITTVIAAVHSPIVQLSPSIYPRFEMIPGVPKCQRAGTRPLAQRAFLLGAPGTVGVKWLFFAGRNGGADFIVSVMPVT